jgi:hypothetical protein
LSEPKEDKSMKPTLTHLTALLLAPLAASHAADKASKSDESCGDRHPAVNCVYPEGAFLHAGKGGRLIDVTKPPFRAKADGKTDDTGALIAAMDHIHRLQRAAYCGRDHSQASYILYLPNGHDLGSHLLFDMKEARGMVGGNGKSAWPGDGLWLAGCRGDAGAVDHGQGTAGRVCRCGVPCHEPRQPAATRLSLLNNDVSGSRAADRPTICCCHSHPVCVQSAASKIRVPRARNFSNQA